MEEVAPMESNHTIQRPSLLLTPACAPSAVMPPRHKSVVITAIKRAPLSQVHQVPTQAELARTLVIGDSGNGSTGFVGITGVSVKGAAGGVPPRGRPV
jgi:hypothetical protein